MEPVVDLRSDTVTRPSLRMREIMAKAEVGDDVFGEDPTTNELQSFVASLLGKEAALFVPSGTMGNQICIKVHTQPGDEVIAERASHVFNYETGGMAFHSSAQVHTIDGVGGAMPIEEIKKAVRPNLYYMPRTSLICVENTHNGAGGTVYPIDLIRETARFAVDAGIRMHLDGARIWNASVATGIAPREYASHFDSVLVCLSKGLGAPIGSVIAGNRQFIEAARHFRKILGGGMRQVGIIAAAGLHALRNNRERLKEDHEKARRFAEIVEGTEGVTVEGGVPQTNIVIINIPGLNADPAKLVSELRTKGVLLIQGGYRSLRAVTHMDVAMSDVVRAAGIVKDILEKEG